jgi:hypothetical protein
MCVILFTKINGKTILAKNRDQVHKPEIELIHEIVNGTEIAYIRDKKTEWIEGMNEDGRSIVNATLNINDTKIFQQNEHSYKYNSFKKSYKKNKIYNILFSKKTKEELENYIKKTNDKGYTFEGNTILVDNDNVYHIENIKNVFFIEKIDKPSVFTNHGINIRHAGYTQGKKGLSSFLRRKLVETELKCNKDVDLYDDFVENVMNVNYTNLDPRFHSYRDRKLTLKKTNLDKDQIFINTTGQLILNITDKEFVYYTDINNSKNVKYINKLPSNYVPKIRVIIKETEKQVQVKKKAFTQKYLSKLYDKFDYNPSKDKHNKTRKHYKHLAKKLEI